VASGWPRDGRNPPWAFFASVDTQPADGKHGLGMDPGFRLPPTSLCGHFLRKAPLCRALSKRHSIGDQGYYRGVRMLFPGSGAAAEV